MALQSIFIAWDSFFSCKIISQRVTPQNLGMREIQIRSKLWVCLLGLFTNWDEWSLCCGLEISQRWGSEVLSLVRLENLFFPFHCSYPRQYKCTECDLVKAFNLSWGFSFQLSGFYLFTLEPGFKGYDGRDNWSGEAASKQRKMFQ